MTQSTIPTNIIEQGTEFIGAIAEWERNLTELSWSDLAAEAQRGQVALFSVDMINGFCHEGPLASPRIKGIIPQIVETFEGAYEVGVRHFILAQDSHPVDAVEFANFPPHCLEGSSEAENIPELAALPFANLFMTVPKRSLNAFHGTELGAWIDEHRDLKVAVVVGDCTDLCIYQMAMHLKLYANAHNLKLRVIVPANAVQTYDIPVAVAREIGSLPHNGDVLNLISLYQMRVNGIEVVRAIR